MSSVAAQLDLIGATLQAAAECGFSAVGIEITPEYQDDIKRRIALMEKPTGGHYGAR